MKLLTRVVAYLLFVCGLFVFIALPDNKYSWMMEMDPSMVIAPVDNAAGNRAIFVFLLLVAIVATQLAIAIKTMNRTERIVSITLVFVAIWVWSLRL